MKREDRARKSSPDGGKAKPPEEAADQKKLKEVAGKNISSIYLLISMKSIFRTINYVVYIRRKCVKPLLNLGLGKKKNEFEEPNQM